MNLEDQICSPKLAKRLKELGVKQDSLWWWVKERTEVISFTDDNIKEVRFENIWKLRLKDYFDVMKVLQQYSAFTVAELGEMLPSNFSTAWYPFSDCPDQESIHRLYNSDYASWHSLWNSVSYGWEDTEANARGYAVLCLIEKGIINVEKLAEAAHG